MDPGAAGRCWEGLHEPSRPVLPGDPAALQASLLDGGTARDSRLPCSVSFLSEGFTFALSSGVRETGFLSAYGCPTATWSPGLWWPLWPQLWVGSRRVKPWHGPPGLPRGTHSAGDSLSGQQSAEPQGLAPHPRRTPTSRESVQPRAAAAGPPGNLGAGAPTPFPAQTYPRASSERAAGTRDVSRSPVPRQTHSKGLSLPRWIWVLQPPRPVGSESSFSRPQLGPWVWVACAPLEWCSPSSDLDGI